MHDFLCVCLRLRGRETVQTYASLSAASKTAVVVSLFVVRCDDEPLDDGPDGNELMGSGVGGRCACECLGVPPQSVLAGSRPSFARKEIAREKEKEKQKFETAADP